MSRRRPRDAPPRERHGQPHAEDRRPGDAAPAPPGRRGGGIVRDVVVLAAVFGIAVGLAELFGAANLGVAFGVGQVVFAIALVVLLIRD